MIKQKSALKNINNFLIYSQNVKNGQTAVKWTFTRFFGHNSNMFWNFEKRIFAWSPVILICNTTIFEKIYFWPLFVTFEVTALVGKLCFVKNSNEFCLFIYWSNFWTAEIGQTLILVKKVSSKPLPRLFLDSGVASGAVPPPTPESASDCNGCEGE